MYMYMYVTLYGQWRCCCSSSSSGSSRFILGTITAWCCLAAAASVASAAQQKSNRHFWVRDLLMVVYQCTLGVRPSILCEDEYILSRVSFVRKGRVSKEKWQRILLFVASYWTLVTPTWILARRKVSVANALWKNASIGR